MSNLRINFKAAALISATVLTLTSLSGTISLERDPYLYVPSIFETYDFSAKESDEKRKKLDLGTGKSVMKPQKGIKTDERVKIC